MKYRIHQSYDHKVEVVEDEHFIYSSSQDSIGQAINYHAAQLQFDINHQERILANLKSRQKVFMEWVNKNEKEVPIDEVK